MECRKFTHKSLVVYFLVLVGSTVHKYAQSFMCRKYLSEMALLSNIILKNQTTIKP